MNKHSSAQRGVSLVELMIAITIGMIVTLGVVTMFSNASDNYREIQKAGQQIENGRYAMELISQDLRNAGYYGDYTAPPAPASATLPDPCAVPTAATAATFWNAAWVYPVQAYDSPGTSPLSCIASGNFVPGTDIVVVRRADSNPLGRPAATPAKNDLYLQANTTDAEIRLGKGEEVNTNEKGPDGEAATVLKKLTPTTTTAADIRKLHVHIYFVSPCNIPASGSTCSGASDDGGRPTPTLKRIELVGGASAASLRTVPLVQGVENLQVDFGLDEIPTVIAEATGQIGDGSPDRYVSAPTAAALPATIPATVSNWQNAVTASIYVLARNTEPTNGYTDSKTYTLGLAGDVTPGGSFRRHLFSSVARINNISVKREIPQ